MERPGRKVENVSADYRTPFRPEHKPLGEQRLVVRSEFTDGFCKEHRERIS